MWPTWAQILQWSRLLLLFSRSVVSDSLRPQGLQHARLPRPSPSLRVYSNSCPLSQGYHPTISSPVVPSSSYLLSFPASRSFPMTQLFPSGGQSIVASASASVLPMNSQGWVPLRLTGLIFLQSKGLSGVFSNTSVQKHQFFGTQPSLWSNSHSYMTTRKKHSFLLFCETRRCRKWKPSASPSSPTMHCLDRRSEGHISMAATICVFYISTIFLWITLKAHEIFGSLEKRMKTQKGTKIYSFLWHSK